MSIQKRVNIRSCTVQEKTSICATMGECTCTHEHTCLNCHRSIFKAAEQDIANQICNGTLRCNCSWPALGYGFHAPECDMEDAWVAARETAIDEHYNAWLEANDE